MQAGYRGGIRVPVEPALRQGRSDEAGRLSVGVDFDRCPPHWYLYVPQLTRIKLLLAEGTNQSLREAHARLAELDQRMRRLNRKSTRTDVLALQALVCLAQGEGTAALETLQAALALAEPAGWIHNFVDLGAPMKELLERPSQQHPGHPYAQQVLEACRTEARRMSPPDHPGNGKGSHVSARARQFSPNAKSNCSPWWLTD
jgi:LuxR family maltose regulon positive regulatory protein